MTKDKLGNLLQIGDYVQVDPTYGGGKWEITDIRGSFLVIKNKGNFSKSINAADVKKIGK